MFLCYSDLKKLAQREFLVSKHFLSIGLFLLMASSTTAFAIGNCGQNKFGHIICAPLGGSILTNKNGEIVCGLGKCVVNNAGIILCSSLPGGSATINYMGVAVCAGGCKSASQNNCRGKK